MNLETSSKSFVLHFGVMGSRWGINRAVCRIYDLLFIAKIPFNPNEPVVFFQPASG